MNRKLPATLVNLGWIDRAIRLIAGGLLCYFGLISQTISDSTFINLVVGLFGLSNIVAASIKICPVYLLTGLSTHKSRDSNTNQHQKDKAYRMRFSKLPQHQKDAIDWSFKRNLLLSIMLPVALVLTIFTYLIVEHSREYELSGETSAALAVAKLALDVKLTRNVLPTDSQSLRVTAIVFHDASGRPVPSTIEKLPKSKSLTNRILAQIANSPEDQNGVWNVDGGKLIRVTTSTPNHDVYVSVFYTPTTRNLFQLSPLLSRLGFIAILALWLSGWAAYYVIKRYAAFVQKTSETINHRNTHDILTGLPNRSSLDDVLQTTIAAANNSTKDGMPESFSILIIDIANFHYFNDTLGHKLGDELLKYVAKKLNKSINEGESLVHFNGDVFCLVTPLCYDSTKAITRADQFHAALSQPMLFQDIQMVLQCHIGVASYPAHTHEGMDLPRLGVIALDHAKIQKRHVSVYDASKNTHSVKNLTVVTGLVSAIENDQLYLDYQPKIDVTTGKLRGVEALIRWEHPVYKNITPFEFIGWAEKSGLINPLTHWILKAAELQCDRWRMQGYEIPIAVNLSPVNLQDNAILESIRASVTTGHFRGGLLELEITENAVVEEADDALHQIRELHELGVPISIDDFGTGLASFSYLRSFPVSNLKIDRSFVNIDDPDKHDQILLRSMIELGHNLNCVVTAEGVENARTLELLESLGCDYAQGYHICRPTTPDGVIAWLTDNHISLCDKSLKDYIRKVA